MDPFERLAALLPETAFATGPADGCTPPPGAVSGPRIVDGGANKGRTVDTFLRLYPTASLWAYEPIPELARKLVRRFDDDSRVQVRQAALGSAPATLILNVLESRTCSSLLTPTGILEKHADKPMDVARRVQVEVVRLDSQLPGGADILKLDLQGYELEALRGAEGLLPTVSAVLCEVAFTDLYAGQPLADEIIVWMEQRGLRLEGFYRISRNADGQPVSADALFLSLRRPEEAP